MERLDSPHLKQTVQVSITRDKSVSCLSGCDALRRAQYHLHGTPAKTAQPESNCERTSEGLKVRAVYSISGFYPSKMSMS